MQNLKNINKSKYQLKYKANISKVIQIKNERVEVLKEQILLNIIAKLVTGKGCITTRNREVHKEDVSLERGTNFYKYSTDFDIVEMIGMIKKFNNAPLKILKP